MKESRTAVLRSSHSAIAASLLFWVLLEPLQFQHYTCGGKFWTEERPVGPDGYWGVVDEYAFENEASCRNELDLIKAFYSKRHVKWPSHLKDAMCARDDDRRLSPDARKRLVEQQPYTHLDSKIARHVLNHDYAKAHGRIIDPGEIWRPCPDGIKPPPWALGSMFRPISR